MLHDRLQRRGAPRALGYHGNLARAQQKQGRVANPLPGQGRKHQERGQRQQEKMASAQGRGRQVVRRSGAGEQARPQPGDQQNSRGDDRIKAPGRVGIEAETGQRAGQQPGGCLPAAQGAQQSPQQRAEQERHQPRFVADAAGANRPEKPGLHGRAPEGQTARQAGLPAAQLMRQQPDRRRRQRADQGRHPALHNRLGAKELEGDGRQVDEKRLDAEVTGEKKRAIVGVLQQMPGFQALEGFVVVITGRRAGQLPKTKKDRHRHDAGQEK